MLAIKKDGVYCKKSLTKSMNSFLQPKTRPRSIEIEESDEEKVITKKESKSSPKSIISMIDDSDDEDEKLKPINAKEHKIIKALECDFID